MLIISIDSTSKEPKYKQVVNQVKALIDGGTLKEGDCLPSSRQLSEQMGVNRTTTYKAYEELWAMGYTESHSGSYTRVRRRSGQKVEEAEQGGSTLDWDQRISAASRDLIETPWNMNRLQTEEFDFVSLSPALELMPVDAFRKCINRVMRTDNSKLLDYGDPFGYQPLREYLADRMKMHGIAVSSEEIILTQGTQNALDLLLRLLVKPGSTVLVEAPTYTAFIPLLKYYQVQVKGIPMTAERMDLNALEELILKYDPAMVFTMPNFQNPTGVTTSQSHRERLINICERYKLPIIEDGFEEEMKYFDKAILPVKALDRKGIVCYLGTFSKIVFPGIRLAWIAAPKELVAKLSKLQQATSLSGNTMIQAATHEFCRLGLYESHIKRMHKLYRKRMTIAMKAIRRYCNQEFVHHSRPIGGYTIWFEIDRKGLDREIFFSQLNKQEVRVMPGDLAFINKTEQTCFRISIAQRNEQEIEEGIKRIGRVLDSIK